MRSGGYDWSWAVVFVTIGVGAGTRGESRQEAEAGRPLLALHPGRIDLRLRF